MKSFLISIILISISAFGFSQKTSFDSIYHSTVKNLIISNPDRALLNVEYLNSISKNNSEKLLAILFKAELLRVYGIKHQALSILHKADSIAQLEKDYISLTRINRLTAAIYREVKIQKTGDSYLEQAISMSNKIKDINSRFEAKGLIEQEKARIEIEKNNFQKSNEHIRKSNKLLSKTNTYNYAYYFLAQNNYLMAENYLMQDKIDSAFFYLNKTKDQLVSAESINSSLKGFVYKGLGDTYCATKSYEEAEEYFLKAKAVADISNFLELKIEVNYSLSILYKKINEYDKYIEYNEAYI